RAVELAARLHVTHGVILLLIVMKIRSTDRIPAETSRYIFSTRRQTPDPALRKAPAADGRSLFFRIADELAKSAQLHSMLETGRRPVLELHAERQAAREQHVLDLGQRLLAEVRRLQQFDFGALHEVADVVDALGLQTVGRTNGQLEFVDRTQQDRIYAGLVGLRRFALAAREIA